MAFRSSPALAALALLAAATGCGGGPGGTASGAWQRTDLWTTPPTVERSAPGAPRERPWHPRVEPGGTRDTRTAARREGRIPPRTPPLGAPEVRVLEQLAGSRLGWHLTLPRSPYLSFVPLGSRGEPWRSAYRVALRDAQGEVHELERLPAEPRLAVPAEPVDLDLSPWSGQTVDLLLEAEGPGPSAARPAWLLWGSPAVYGRRAGPALAPSSDRPNVLLIGVDTLRADALGVYGRHPSPSPALDRLAAESDLWLDAFSTFNNTNPSFTSIHTGLYGKNHGIYDLTTPLPDGYTTLAELFSRAGYATLAVIAAHHLGPRTSGLGQGFDEVTVSRTRFAAETVADMAMDWLAAPRKPFFVWLHFFDVHTPHTPPDPYAVGLRPEAPRGLEPITSWVPFRPLGRRSFREPLWSGHRDLYLGEVAYVDHQIDRLLDFLRSRHLLETTIVAFVADHGENLGEHGLYATHAGLWDTTTHVPLWLRWPGGHREGRRLPGLVQTLDLFPTLLTAAGLEVPPQDGVDLRQLTGGERYGRRMVFSEGANHGGVSVRTPTHRLYVTFDDGTLPAGSYLYDLTDDPGETRDVSSREPAEAARLEEALRRWRADTRHGGEKARPVPLSKEELERLHALGYAH